MFSFSFSNQLISKQHLVRIINEYTVWDALKLSNWVWFFFTFDMRLIILFLGTLWSLRYFSLNLTIFNLILYQALTMGYFRFPLGWVPFSSACFFQRLLNDLVFICNTKYIEMCSLLSYVKTNILFLPGVYSIFRSHLSVTDLSFFLGLFTFESVSKILIIWASAYQSN